jgi:hypothetical protein
VLLKPGRLLRCLLAQLERGIADRLDDPEIRSFLLSADDPAAVVPVYERAWRGRDGR